MAVKDLPFFETFASIHIFRGRLENNGKSTNMQVAKFMLAKFYFEKLLLPDLQTNIRTHKNIYSISLASRRIKLDNPLWKIIQYLKAIVTLNVELWNWNGRLVLVMILWFYSFMIS